MDVMVSLAAVIVCLVLGTGFAPQAVAVREAWAALNAGRAREAAEAFSALLRKHPQEPALLLGAGIAANQLGDSEGARRWLLDALKNDPALLPASLLLGEILYARGDLAEAVHVYQQALANQAEARASAPSAPADTRDAAANGEIVKRITTKLERWRGELALHERFTHTLGDHFTVLFEGPAEAALAQKAVEALEAAYWRIGSILYTYPDDLITVVLYTREQFRDVTQSPAWAGGAFDGRIRVPVQGALDNAAEFTQVLTHEFVHALVQRLAPRGVPQWLNEGLAMNFDGTNLETHLARVRAAGNTPSLRQLEGPFAGLNTRDAALAYSASAVAVKRILDDAGAAAIVGLLGDLGRGSSLDEALRRHAAISYDDLQAGLSAR